MCDLLHESRQERSDAQLLRRSLLLLVSPQLDRRVRVSELSSMPTRPPRGAPISKVLPKGTSDARGIQGSRAGRGSAVSAIG